MSARVRVGLVCAVGLVAAGCGTGGANRPAAGSGGTPSSDPKIEVVRVSFPPKQAVSRRVALELVVRNGGTETVPLVAVALHSLYYNSTYPGLADPRRPIWILDEGPGAKPHSPIETVPFDTPNGDVTDDEEVWQTAALGPAESRTLRYYLTPVRAGAQTLAYQVVAARPGSAGPQPLAPAREGRVAVAIEKAPPKRYVNPATGAVELGKLAVQPGP